MVRAVFLDRDGVIVVPEFREGRSFAPRRLEDFAIYPDARDCLDRLKESGFLLIVVTNQPDVGAGLVGRTIIEAMHAQLLRELPIDSIRTCYHTSADRCRCRKPCPGLIVDSGTDFGIDLSDSFVIGDRKSDIDAGLAVGCTTVFIDLDYIETKPTNAAFRAGSLSEATNWIMGQATTPSR